MPTPSEILKQFWGYDSFRPGQSDIIRSATEGRDVLGILPTGGGKSICFQVPVLMEEGLGLVVTPLIALMKDQVLNLEKRGIRAMAIHSGMNRREVDTALNNAAYGDFKFLYVSPERLATQLFRNWLGALKISHLIVDEAHCISQWGYDFRPEYLRIAEIRRSVDVPVIALTATATPEVAQDIMEKLGFRAPNVVKSGFERPNLSYICRESTDRKGDLLRCCNSLAGSGIIYVRSRKLTEELARFLKRAGVSADYYHAGLTAEERSRRQDGWIKDRTRVMVCTNAFGMGIDKPDVRFVLHCGLPDSPEAYFQEAGRAGRDGRESFAVMYWNKDDCTRLRQQHSLSFPSLEYIEGIYHKIHAFFGISYETGAGRELRLDFTEFCKAYGLNKSQAWYAIGYIGRCGHWTLMENVEVATRVMVTVERSELYDIIFEYEEMRNILDVMMRRYEGLFSYPVTIDEEYVAGKAGTGIPQLRQMLYLLSLRHVVRYIPRTTSDIILLHQNRLYPKDVNLRPELYSMLMETSGRRMEEMISLVSDSSRCRAARLLEYFGQENAPDCRNCDVCRKKRKSEGNGERLARALIDFINIDKGGRYTMEDIKQAFGVWDISGEYLGVLRRLIDEGRVPGFTL